MTAGPAAPSAAQGQRIDARGMTVMPGFIDAHRHIINGNDQEWAEVGRKPGAGSREPEA